jgi:hypothetical protein
MLLLTPIALVGLLFFAIVLAATALPPLYAVTALLNGRWIVSVVVGVSWVLWLRYGGPLRRFVFEGFEHSSL